MAGESIAFGRRPGEPLQQWRQRDPDAFSRFARLPKSKNRQPRRKPTGGEPADTLEEISLRGQHAERRVEDPAPAPAGPSPKLVDLFAPGKSRRGDDFYVYGWRAVFAGLAAFRGPHWSLDDEESSKLGRLSHEAINNYPKASKFMAQNFERHAPAVVLGLSLVQIVVLRLTHEELNRGTRRAPGAAPEPRPAAAAPRPVPGAATDSRVPSGAPGNGEGGAPASTPDDYLEFYRELGIIPAGSGGAEGGV